MFIFPGSSSSAPAAPRPLEPEVKDKLAALAVDEPLPPLRSSDQLRLLIQSPYRVFAYWTFRNDPFATLRRAFGSRAETYRLVLRVKEDASGVETLYEAPESGEYWLQAKPDTSYTAQVGFYSFGRPFIRLLASGSVRTPRASISPHVASAPEFRIVPEQFMRLLAASGYASDALIVALEAADARSRFTATRTAASQLTSAELPPLDEADRFDLRRLLAKLAFDEPLDILLAGLPESLRRWLAEAGFDLRDPESLKRLREILAQLLGTGTNIFQHTALEESEITVGFGGSLVRQPLPSHRIWLPSMNIK